MVRLLKSRLTRFWLWLFPAKEVVADIMAEIADDIAQEPTQEAALIEQPKKRVKLAKEDNFDSPSWYYLGDLLDRLSDYFIHLKVFKKHDPEAYDLYSQIGGEILSDRTLMHSSKLPATWKEGKRPGFGMIFFGGKDAESENFANAKFAYFQKIERTFEIQYAEGEIYRVSYYYAAKNNPNMSVTCQYYVSVAEDNSVTLLKNIEREELRIHPKNRKMTGGKRLPSKKKGGATIVRLKWDYPRSLKMLHKDRGDRFGEDSVENLGRNLFCIVASGTNEAWSDGFKVTAEKNCLAASFQINMLRTPYFFADREKVVTENGKTKKIFHIVRTHKRILADGSEQNVKSHFRGLRIFNWNDYRISISMPGKHHAHIADFRGGSIEHGSNDGKELMTTLELGKEIKAHYNGKRG